MQPDLEVSQGAFQDSTLNTGREQVPVIKEVSQMPQAKRCFSNVGVKGELLCRVTKVLGGVVNQLPVPQPFRYMVLDFGKSFGGSENRGKHSTLGLLAMGYC